MRVAFLGATKGMGRALARLMAERGDSLFLLGRNEADLEKSAADLTVRGASSEVGWAHCDLLDASSFEPSLAEAAKALQDFDTVVVTAALFATQEELEEDPALAEKLTTANFTNTMLFCEAARKRLLTSGGGTLCVFSSVAGERGRKPVVIYGASKAGLSRYLEGLDHRYRSAGLKVVTVKPGFVKTGMTDGLDAPPFAGEPGPVAQIVLKALDRGQPVVYAPGAWRYVMGVIRLLPRAVMRRVGF